MRTADAEPSVELLTLMAMMEPGKAPGSTLFEVPPTIPEIES